jgi:hypothetical protein
MCAYQVASSGLTTAAKGLAVTTGGATVVGATTFTGNVVVSQGATDFAACKQSHSLPVVLSFTLFCCCLSLCGCIGQATGNFVSVQSSSATAGDNTLSIIASSGSFSGNLIRGNVDISTASTADLMLLSRGATDVLKV